MKRICLLLLTLCSAAFAQTWVPQLTQPKISFNNVQIYDMTRGESASTLAFYGQVNVMSVTASGGFITYTTNRSMTYGAVGHTVCATIGGDQGGCTSGGTILTPGNPIAPDLLGTCVLTAVHSTPPPVTYTCASTSTNSWTQLDPHANQEADMEIYNNQLWQVYTESTNAGPGPMTYPGLLYVRTSSTPAATYPPVWNTPFELDTSSIPACPTFGDRPDMRVPMLGVMPNGDLVVWFLAYCIHPNSTYYTSTYWYHHNHTQPYTSGWTLTQFTAVPPMWGTATWGCIMDSGRMVNDPIDGMPIMVVGGIPSGTSLCVNSISWSVKTTDNGVTWNLVNQLWNGISPQTMEFSLANPTGTTWISFLRNYGNCPLNHFCPLYLSISTDNMVTWTPWVNSGIPHSDVCERVFNQASGTENAVAPWSICGNIPASGMCVLFYTDRMGCSAAGSTSEVAVQYDPSLVVSQGAAYTSTLKTTVLHDGVIGSSLDGYMFPLFLNSTTFNLGWHGIVNSATPIKLWQTRGQFSDITSVITIHGGGAFNGSVVSSPGGISCTITSGVASGLCSWTIFDGSSITLTAYVGRGSSFGGFSGWCGGSGSPSTCTVNTAQNVTATFNVLVPNVRMGGSQRQGGRVIAQ